MLWYRVPARPLLRPIFTFSAEVVHSVGPAGADELEDGGAGALLAEVPDEGVTVTVTVLPGELPLDAVPHPAASAATEPSTATTSIFRAPNVVRGATAQKFISKCPF